MKVEKKVLNEALRVLGIIEISLFDFHKLPPYGLSLKTKRPADPPWVSEAYI